MRVAAAEGVNCWILLAIRFARLLPLASGPMQMVGALRHEFIHVRFRIDAIHPLVMGPRDHMPQVADHIIGKHHLAKVVVVKPPWIGRAASHHLESPCDRMYPPDRTVDHRAVLIGRAWNANATRSRDSMPTIEPTVRAPSQSVDDVVPHFLGVEAIQDRLALKASVFFFTVRHIVSIPIGNKQKLWWRREPHPAIANFNAS